jgi:uncharacterized SAM-binding protein YcdF (DUF218 family)
VLVRLRPEVQEVPRSLTGSRQGDIARDALIGSLVLGLGAVALIGFATFRIWETGARDDRRAAGAIVVLGAAQYDGRPSPVFEARLDHAVSLYHDGLAPLLVVTGGKRPGDRWTEAETARRYALRHGVPASAIVLEDRGTSTRESLDSVVDILAGRGIGDAIFVSDPTHMFRVLRIARDGGITALGSPTRTSPVERDLGRRVDATVHEIGALALYFLTRAD